MRAVVQRVLSASVEVDGDIVGNIGNGFLVLLGVGEGDAQEDAAYIADKISFMRVFEDDNGKMNLPLTDAGGEVLLVSQFTLYGDARHGRRPSFSSAARPETADKLYMEVKARIEANGIKVETGVFQAHMNVSLVNSGPVTLLLDSAKQF